MHGAAYPGILAAENTAGMALVNHSWTYAGLPLLPAGRWPAEVDRTSRLLCRITAAPSGACDRGTAWAIVRWMPS
jgi:hypothetical protein